MNTCGVCETQLTREPTCGFCFKVLNLSGKEKTIEENAARLHWDEMMAQALMKPCVVVARRLVRSRATATQLAEMHKRSAASYEKRILDQQRELPVGICFLYRGLYVYSEDQAAELKPQWYSAQPLPWPVGWYHTDETVTDLYGPFATRELAEASMMRYAAMLDQRPETD